MSLSTEQAARLVLATAVSHAIADRVTDIRDELRPELNAGDRTTALMAWAMEHNPTAIVTTQTVNSAWVDRILKAGGEWTDPETGEVLEVPGLGTSQASAQLRVTVTDDARAWALTALDATMHSPLALTGDTDV